MLAFFMRKRRYDDSRESSTKRGYGYRWQIARKAYLAKNPHCVDHRRRGYVVAATVVDHIKPHRGDDDLFWDESNWQALCKSCHDSHKQRLEKSGIDSGCDADGLPMDGNHPWNI